MSKEQITLKTVDIKGKDYVPVHERIRIFRNDAQFKGFRLITEILNRSETDILMVAKVFNPAGEIAANGHSHEFKAASYINKTSFIENCETSAIGRALGSLGIGIDSSFASADEVLIAISAQNSKKAEVPQREKKPEIKDNKFNLDGRKDELLKELADSIREKTTGMNAPMKKTWVKEMLGESDWKEITKQETFKIESHLRALKDSK